MMPDPPLKNLDGILANLAGVQRVFLSGGEPLLRRDLPEIVTMYSEFILGLPTNATRGVAMASRLAGKVAFVNIGFDGPRAAFTQVRGDYDKVVAGGRAFLDAGLPGSLSAVVLRSTLPGPPARGRPPPRSAGTTTGSSPGCGRSWMPACRSRCPRSCCGPPCTGCRTCTRSPTCSTAAS